MDLVTASYFWFGVLGTVGAAITSFAWRRKARFTAWAWAIALLLATLIAVVAMLVVSGALTG